MNRPISEIAEDVWCTLYKRGPMSVRDLASQVKGAASNEVMLAVGWLAGEGQVEILHASEFKDMTVRSRS